MKNNSVCNTGSKLSYAGNLGTIITAAAIIMSPQPEPITRVAATAAFTDAVGSIINNPCSPGTDAIEARASHYNDLTSAGANSFNGTGAMYGEHGVCELI